MSNSISFLGRLGRDPELKQVGQNDLLEFTVANDVGFGDRKVTNWFRCTVWGKRATSLQNHLSKGSQVFIVGELTAREFEKKDGAKGFSVEVRVDKLDFAGGRGEGEQQSAPTPQQQSAPPQDLDASEEMPF